MILGVPPISIQTAINSIKHYLKLKINENPEDTVREYIKSCTVILKYDMAIERMNMLQVL